MAHLLVHLLIYIITLGAAAKPAPAETLFGTDDHRYERGDAITLYAKNVVGPNRDRTEAYHLYDFPICRPEGEVYKWGALARMLTGDRTVKTPYRLPFRTNIQKAALCNRSMNAADLMQLQTAIQMGYVVQMMYDGLPLPTLFGDFAWDAYPEQARRYFLSTHIEFIVYYNPDRVIRIEVGGAPNSTYLWLDEGLKALDQPDKRLNVAFSYSVTWNETDERFEHRMDSFYVVPPYSMQWRWLHGINSCGTVLLLAGFLAALLRQVLETDLKRSAWDDDDDDGSTDEGPLLGRSWRHLSTAALSSPAQPALLAAMNGAGAQMLAAAVCLEVMALAGFLDTLLLGGWLVACVLLCCLTSAVSGCGGRLHLKAFRGPRPKHTTVLCALVFCGPAWLVFFLVNSVATWRHACVAFPVITVVIVAGLWAAIITPLTFLGAAIGKSFRLDWSPPGRASSPRLATGVPWLPWYRSTAAQMLLAGVLPFSAIYAELADILKSIWWDQVYNLYPLLLVVFAMLLIITAIVTVTLTYFQLAAGDYRWWWRSFLCGGSTAIFVYGYTLYYTLRQTLVISYTQLAFFLGYNFLLCYAQFLLLGWTGFVASSLFVQYLYRRVRAVHSVESTPLQPLPDRAVVRVASES